MSASFRDALIIGADQIAVLDGRILGKPGDHQTAVEQLMAASGKTVRFMTAVCMLDAPDRLRYEHIDETVVRFRTLTGGWPTSICITTSPTTARAASASREPVSCSSKPSKPRTRRR